MLLHILIPVVVTNWVCKYDDQRYQDQQSDSYEQTQLDEYPHFFPESPVQVIVIIQFTVSKYDNIEVAVKEADQRDYWGEEENQDCK